jgi:hypothetical protein
MANTSPSYTPPAPSTSEPISLGLSSGAWWMIGAVVLACLLYYFIGIDEGAASVFGKTMVVHEFVHDARHFLGFPCH